MKFLKRKSGTSLVEVLIAISIFTLASLITSVMLFETVKLEKRSTIQNALYEDARLILQQLTNEIQRGTIDYEEYYNMYVVQGALVDTPASGQYYGINYGVYGSRFYDPGMRLDGALTENPRDLGVECSFPDNAPSIDDCEVVYTLSTDLNTGMNPYNAETVDAMTSSNAFCDQTLGACTDVGVMEELYLIDSTGTKKTIIGRKLVNAQGDYVLGIVRMRGLDVDQNGVIDTFTLSDEFVPESPIDASSSLVWLDPADRGGIIVPPRNDLSTAFNAESYFAPFTPLRINVMSLRFIINPVEDPYKAYGETAMQSHPSVTIIITVELAEQWQADYPGTLEPITVQTTVAAGVLGGIATYPPTSNMGWVNAELDSVPDL